MKRNLLLLTLCLFCIVFGAFITIEAVKISPEDVKHAQKLIGMEFSPAETDSMLTLLDEQEKNFENMRKVDLPNSVPPAFNFNPIPVGKSFDKIQKLFRTSDYSNTTMPANINELAFYSVGQLANLIQTKKISSLKLTQFFLERIKKYSPQLLCTVTCTDSLALVQARQADAEIKAGHYKGLLHGIPFGVKDMYATKSYKTTFGTPPYREQLIREDATIVTRLQKAGAILIAKLSLGELAMDDVWFGGQTKNPWDQTKGSSGSSAGPASSVAAGLLPFAIGSETWGSIVSPSTVCGITGLRPTYGRVSRYGAMALSWTMDKVGPICRNAEDCAIVLKTISGADGKDQSLVDLPFNYAPVENIKGLKIGFIQSDFEKDSTNRPFNDAALERLKKLGAMLVPISLPALPVNDMSVLLMSEAASAFDELTLSNRDDQMVQQQKYRWPNFFRAAHFVPATEYIRAQRLRYLLIQQMDKVMSSVDIFVAPSLSGDNLLITNLTGHPSVVVPNGFIDSKTPTSIVFTGQLYEEGSLLAAARIYQESTGFHLKHPPGF